MATSTTKKKVIKSVIMLPGEKFTLPPGSKLLGTTDQGNLTSNCDIPTLEEIRCYVAIFGSDIDNGTTGVAFYEGEQSRIQGYRMNNVRTNFASDYQANDSTGIFNMAAMGTELKALIPGIINTDFHGLTDSDRGGLNILLIQTIPSIAEDLQLIYKTDAALDSNSDVTTYIDFIPREDAIAANYEDVPLCPTGTTPNPVD